MKTESADEILARLNENTHEVQADEKSSNRRRAANQWVAHFLAVAELDLSGCKTTEDIENKLIESWEAKEEVKNDKVQQLVGKFTTPAA